MVLEIAPGPKSTTSRRAIDDLESAVATFATFTGTIEKVTVEVGGAQSEVITHPKIESIGR